MSEPTLRELIYGKGAHVDPVSAVEDISAQNAARRLEGYPHSIWQIVEHMNYWMSYELARIAGEKPYYPQKAIESWPAHPEGGGEGVAAEEHWQATIGRFADLLASLARMSESEGAVLERVVRNAGPQSPRESTVRSILWQMAAHNSYHTGQVALLRRQLGAWPPRRGGDSW
jgi:uncharacterized damage-inducible protein DinB